MALNPIRAWAVVSCCSPAVKCCWSRCDCQLRASLYTYVSAAFISMNTERQSESQQRIMRDGIVKEWGRRQMAPQQMPANIKDEDTWGNVKNLLVSGVLDFSRTSNIGTKGKTRLVWLDERCYHLSSFNFVSSCCRLMCVWSISSSGGLERANLLRRAIPSHYLTLASSHTQKTCRSSLLFLPLQLRLMRWTIAAGWYSARQCEMLETRVH